jgi:hypothetical protein
VRWVVVFSFFFLITFLDAEGSGCFEGLGGVFGEVG